MKIIFKITEELVKTAISNLSMPHSFAAERVGFFVCRVGALDSHGLVVLAHHLHPVEDGDYLDDPTVGAAMGPAAIRKALQLSFRERAAMFHVHIHGHEGKPRFSRTDSTETARFVPDFWNVQPDLPHGAIVLSKDSAYGRCWVPGFNRTIEISEFVSVGVPMRRL